MSTDQDKEPFALKRNRGGEGGLDGLGGTGLLLGNPDKKKRKSTSQAPSFAPLSEYAPPPNPSSDHLVASNPFDDNYNFPPPSLKPLSSTNPYFGSSNYSGFSGYGPPRMAPHIQNRMPSPYGSPYQMRSQPHPFAQNQMGPMGMGFSRPPAFGYGHPDNPVFQNQMFNNNGRMHLSSGQQFRPGPGETISQMPFSNMIQNHNGPEGLGPGFGPEGASGGTMPLAVKPGLDMSPGLPQPHSNFAQSTMLVPKQEPGDGAAKKITSPRKQNQSLEQSGTHDGQTDPKGKPRGNVPAGLEGGVEKINGILHPSTDPLKKSPQALLEPTAERNQRPVAGNRAGSAATPSKAARLSSSASSSEPVYPCGICLSEVNEDQEAILCEASCQKWFHRICTGMSEAAYNLLTAETSAVWGCDSCMEDKGAQLLKTREATGPSMANSEGQS